MDGIYPQSYCDELPQCSRSAEKSTWVSSAFIKNRGQVTNVTRPYDEGYSNIFTNNPPPTPLYVRTAPSQYDPSKRVFWINGWERPRLLLTKGKKYQFNVNTFGAPFYFTTDPNGGKGGADNVTSVRPSDYYVTTYTMDATPSKFYYQSANTPGMGGEVVII